jgi:hypothetical protein
MTEPKYEEFLWIKTSGDIGTGFMRLQFGMSRDDPMPFILTVMPSYVAHKTQKTLPLNITEVQNYSLTSALIERAAESTRTWLAEGGLDRREIPQQMHTHKHSQ